MKREAQGRNGKKLDQITSFWNSQVWNERTDLSQDLKQAEKSIWFTAGLIHSNSAVCQIGKIEIREKRKSQKHQFVSDDGSSACVCAWLV